MNMRRKLTELYEFVLFEIFDCEYHLETLRGVGAENPRYELMLAAYIAIKNLIENAEQLYTPEKVISIIYDFAIKERDLFWKEYEQTQLIGFHGYDNTMKLFAYKRVINYIDEQGLLKVNSKVKAQENIKALKEEMCGKQYRHFKGNLYRVIDLAIHSETEEPLVVYKSEANPEFIWCRPLEMFLSKVDKDKYPDITQEMRFERVAK